MRHVFRDVYREEGLMGFTKGMKATAARLFPMEAVCLLCYDEFSKIVKNRE